MILNAFDLKGKVAIVTGCDTGLGQGMALGLAEAGCDIVGINIVEPTDTIAKVEALGRTFLSLKADVSKVDTLPALVDQAVSRFGRVDILVNNAGIIRREDAINFSEKDWDDVMNINIKSVFFMSQAVARQFMAQGRGGKIVNIASMLSYQGGIRVPSYTASKSGVMGITRLLAGINHALRLEEATHQLAVVQLYGEIADPQFREHRIDYRQHLSVIADAQGVLADHNIKNLQGGYA